MNHQAEPEYGGAQAPVTDGSPAADAAAAAEAGIAEAEPAPANGTEAAPAARAETGEPRVDAALRQLDRLTELPVTEHPPVFEYVQAELTAVLGQLDPESAGAGD